MGAIATSSTQKELRHGGMEALYRSYIKKILSNSSVCGTLQQYKTEKVDDIDRGKTEKSSGKRS